MHSGTRTQFVVRPNRATYASNRVRGVAAKLIALSVVIQLGRTGWVGGIIGVAAMVVLFGGAHRYMRSVRVEVSETGVLHAGLLRTRRWTWSEVGTLVLVEGLTNDPLTGRVYEWLIALDRRGKRMFQVTSAVWADADRARLAEAFDPIDRFPGETSAAELHARHPAALNFAQREPLLTGLIASVVIIGAAALGCYLVIGPG